MLREMLGRVRRGVSLRAPWPGKLATLLLESKVKVNNKENKQGQAKSRLGPVNLAPFPQAG